MKGMHVESLERYLTWFLRLMGVVFFLLGLQHCFIILDVGATHRFEKLSLDQQTALGFFAVVDLTAAVGLWLASRWGAVIWLIAAGADIVFHIFFPRLVTTPIFLSVFHAASMAVYLWLSIQIARQRNS